MGLADFLKGLFGFGQETTAQQSPHSYQSQQSNPAVKLQPLQYQASPRYESLREVDERPYMFSWWNPISGKYLDLRQGQNQPKLASLQLPFLDTPESIANWLEIPIGQLAWLVHRFEQNGRPDEVHKSHYHYHWMKKRSGGFRLIESPKSLLKQVQYQILDQILDIVPAHNAAHGFVRGRSILTNAEPHVGQRVLVKLDLENFYASISFNRVVAIFRALGYCRETGIWLARLTTSALPRMTPFPNGGNYHSLQPYQRRHLPQGAPTSPALANLSAYSLDVRLEGMASAFDVTYTRYADDLTFSGSERLLAGLKTFIPLVTKVIRHEQFVLNLAKRKVIRNNQRQQVTGVVVNEKTNVSRKSFDQLKATLHNCIQKGAAGQNHHDHPDFSAHLRGRIAHVKQLNKNKGKKLEQMFQQIHW